MKPKILLVDDEENILSGLKRGLRGKYDIFTALSGEEGLAVIEKQGPFAVVVSDFSMPSMDGATFLARVRDVAEDTVRMMLSGKADLNDTIQTVNEGKIFRFLGKPCSIEHFELALSTCVDQYTLVRREKEAREQEIKIAGKIQDALLVEETPQQIIGVDLAALTIPSRVVDGDFIDFFVHSEKCFDFILGDVMGKGIPAALIGAATRNKFSRALNKLLLSAKGKNIPETHKITEEVNRELCDKLMSIESFITLIMARVNVENRTLEFTDCGHTPGLLFRKKTQTPEVLKGSLPPLGFPLMKPFFSETISIEPGDIVFFYSDGLIDARNPDREFFGFDRISSFVAANQDMPGELLLKKLYETVKKYSGMENLDDDLTAVLVKIL
ncbi:MAG: SpoIIE family protein phosphatase [Candidatus Riflebacteria bacterium]|nr:SpoIIE family protein phosphatase [Candidatus Riflebacteria bacterium]